MKVKILEKNIRSGERVSSDKKGETPQMIVFEKGKTYDVKDIGFAKRLIGSEKAAAVGK